jgi:hypothetical protein
MFLHVFIRQDLQIFLSAQVRRKMRFYGQTAFWPLRMPHGAQMTRKEKKLQRDLVRRDGAGGRVLERKWQLCQESAGEF